jgi:hypothetical protein
MPCPNGAPITSYTIKCIAENASEIPSREIKITLEELLKILEETTFESSYHNVIPAFILNIAASSSHTTVTDTKPNLATIEEEFSNRVSSKTKNRKGSGTLKSSHTAVTDTKPKLATIEEEFSSRASSKTKSRKGSSTLKSSQTTIRDFKPNLATIKEEFSSRASSEENEKKVATKTKKMKKAKGNDGVQPKARQPSILEKQRQEKKKRMISNLAPVNPFALEAGLPSEYTYVVKDLFPGEIYQFVVAAENRCGLAEFSPFSDFIKMDPTGSCMRLEKSVH